MNLNQVNGKPSLNLKLGLEALRKRKKQCLICSYCPIYLNIKCCYTKEFIEAMDRNKICKLEYVQCNKVIQKCEGYDGNFTYDNIESAKLHIQRYHKTISINNENNEINEIEINALPID